MSRLRPELIRFAQILILIMLAVGVYMIVTLGVSEQPVHALPEYATRTGEPCNTCHVSPGGGGPRTLRGLLWAARGRPDQVPALPGVLIAPGVEIGAELYDVTCAACHGAGREGLFAMSLIGTGIDGSTVRSFVQRGIPRSGMPSFDGQFSDDQLEALVTYIVGLANNQIEPPPDSYPLPAGEFKCEPHDAPAPCGGN